MLQKQQICSKMSNVNYRLGALGTLNLPGVANGNMAVGDLLAALKWTKENVAAFGGGPDKITVAGQSAGAWYTVMLTGHPEASKPVQEVDCPELSRQFHADIERKSH